MRKIVRGIIALLIAGVFVSLYFIDPIKSINKMAYFIIAAVFFAISAILFTISFYDKRSKRIKWLENRLEAWNNISYRVQQSGDLAFNELPVGIMVYDDEYIIKWANKNIKAIFPMQLIDAKLGDVAPDILMNIRAKTESFIFKFNDKFFEVVLRNDNKLVYFFDQTEREELQITYDNHITAIGIMSIDNLEESIKRYDMQEQSNIRGQILGEISDYATSHNAFLQSYNDRLVLMFDREHLDAMIADKFDILNEVRDVAAKNHLKTSVSMGVACFDKTIDEVGTLAQQALELAEKRGGDQVVVNIENEKIQYFGGKTNAVEKNTLVTARVQANAIKDLIMESNNVLVMCHKQADCDAFASMLCMLVLSKSTGKDTKAVFEIEKTDDSVKKFYDYIKANEPELLEDLISPSQADIKSTTLLISVDTQGPNIVMYPELLDLCKRLVVIDHHRHNDVSFNEPIVNYVEPYASSATELLTEFFNFFEEARISPVLATTCLSGIVVDTNNFTYRTGSRTFEAASILKELDGDMALVRSLLRDGFDTETLLAKLVARTEIVLGKFAIVKVPNDKVLDQRSFLAKVSDKLLTIDGVQASFTIGCIEQPGFIGISARSLNEVNVQIILEEMGGGGHLNAAAFQQEGTTVDALYNQLIDILKRDFNEEGEELVKVILLDDVKGRGKKDQIIDVANGYGNYLLTNNLAVMATEENLKNLEAKKAKEAQDEIDHKILMEHLKAEIEAKSINLYIKVGANGKPFGIVTTKQICEEFEAQTGIKLDKKKVELPSEINSVGIYQAVVNLHKEVVANIEIKVLAK